jgi:hypothetical protein
MAVIRKVSKLRLDKNPSWFPGCSASARVNELSRFWDSFPRPGCSASARVNDPAGKNTTLICCVPCRGRIGAGSQRESVDIDLLSSCSTLLQIKHPDKIRLATLL